jgi:hypothetical protein
MGVASRVRILFRDEVVRMGGHPHMRFYLRPNRFSSHQSVIRRTQVFLKTDYFRVARNPLVNRGFPLSAMLPLPRDKSAVTEPS